MRYQVVVREGSFMVFRDSLNRIARAVSPKPEYTNIPPRIVADVMTRELVTLTPDHSFAEAVGIMANRPYRHIPVVRPDGRLAGVISDRDLLRKIAGTTDWKTKTVEEVMTREVLTVTPQTSLSTAVQEIVARRINCLPVLDDKDKVCGLVTSTDLLSAFQKLQGSLEKLTKS
jgi:CBS domain-containing protein